MGGIMDFREVRRARRIAVLGYHQVEQDE